MNMKFMRSLLQIRIRLDRVESEVIKHEKEAEVERLSQEQVNDNIFVNKCKLIFFYDYTQERADIMASYQRLEQSVIAHLQNLSRAIEIQPLNTA